jgi:hypothetical protein
MSAYTYPAHRHRRRHGPHGYQAASEFRDWLRDEFAFRCVYCLEREQWGNWLGHFHIDHFEAASLSPASRLEYDNLLYGCQACNLLKADHVVLDPLRVFTRASVSVKRDGRMRGRTKAARTLIDLLQLNSPSYQQRRRLMLAILQSVRRVNRELYVDLMRFPDDLPDLSVLRPPGGNSRPAGIKRSFYVLRQAGKLPSVY